jgi:hypothetical protein
MQGMQRLSVNVWVKHREAGLLSIADSMEKSLVPLLGGVRVVDLYLGPLFFYGVRGITVVMDDEMAQARDYLLYKYRSHRIKVQNEQDAGRIASGGLRQRRTDSLLVLRADGALLADWKGLVERLAALDDGTYAIVAAENERIGYFLNPCDRFGELIEPSPASGVDAAWEKIDETLRSRAKPLKVTCTLYGLRTAHEYYTFQMAMMRDLEAFSGFLSAVPGEEKEKENLARVEGTGFVKDSYVSSSCVVEGYVEGSILFPHVRVGQNAAVVNSVVMSNNYIGGGAVVHSAILCTGGQLPKVTPNVGERSRVGEDDKTGANNRYPDFIFGGITLVGENVEIPKDFRIARNCYIPTGTDKALLKGKDRIKAGDSLPDGHKSNHYE